MSRRCSDCFWYDECTGSRPCIYYSPLGDDAEAAAIDDVIEAGRAEYESEWEEYIKENT